MGRMIKEVSEDEGIRMTLWVSISAVVLKLTLQMGPLLQCPSKILSKAPGISVQKLLSRIFEDESLQNSKAFLSFIFSTLSTLSKKAR